MKQIKLILSLLAIIAVAVVLILNKFLVYGIVLIGIAFVIYLIWYLLIKNKDKRITELEKTILANKSLIQELEQRKINISQITPILKLALWEIDSIFIRPFNRRYSNDDNGKLKIDDNGKLKFVATFKIDIRAQYGVDVNELRFKYENDKVIVNINPKFLSFTKRVCHWEYREVMELENGIEELKWIEKPLQQQVITILKAFFIPPDMEIILSDYCDDTFVDIETFLNSKFISDNQKNVILC
jgi:Ca2+/Na+ antiporter